MPQAGRTERAGAQRTRHEIEVDAPADVVYGIVADATRWPRYFDPTVHVEREGLGGSRERLRIWALGNGAVRAWTSLRELDPVRWTVTFRQEVSAPPVASMGGTWTVRPVRSPGPAGTDRVRLTLDHDFEAVDGDPDAVAWIARGTDTNSRTELANVKRLAEGHRRLAELEFSFEDALEIAAKPSEVYAYLHDAARWPDRLPHVASLELDEDGEGALQLMSMRTRAKDGSTHVTESARICFPDERIVYKQLVTPALMAAHTGEWLIERVDAGVLVRALHTIRLNEEALGTIPAAGRTVAETQAFVRASVGGNSAATLRHAREFLESA